MKILVKHLAFVKEQIANQERLARRFEGEPYRRDQHNRTAERLRSLADDMVTVQKIIDDAEAARARTQSATQNLTLTMADLEGLPDELRNELSISDSDVLEFTIVDIIGAAGGVLSLDKILIDLWHATKEVHKRSAITSRLYRMAQKQMIFQVPNKKGVYSTHELSEDEARKLFGRDEINPLE